MARLNLNDDDLNSLLDCINDSILRASSKTKRNLLESLKKRILRANNQHEQERQKKSEDRSSPVSKKSNPQV